MEQRQFTVTLSRRDGYAFEAEFDVPGAAALAIDEPPPLGENRGPNASRVLGAAVGHCLAASLLFCLEKARVEVSALRVRVEGTVTRNEEGRLRIAGLRVTLAPDVGAAGPERMARCVELFEDFCIVTGSVRRGIPVEVAVQAAGV